MKTILNKTRGFTLVELLVAIAIIAILTGIIVTNLTSSRSKARDVKRISDLGQIQLALELYFDRCKQYPASASGALPDTYSVTVPLSTSLSNGCATGISLGSFIANIPNTPKAGEVYGYAVNNGSYPTDYILHTILENTNEVVKDGATPGFSQEFTCSRAVGSVDYCLSPR